jgi:hypothetical protein
MSTKTLSAKSRIGRRFGGVIERAPKQVEHVAQGLEGIVELLRRHGPRRTGRGPPRLLYHFAPATLAREPTKHPSVPGHKPLHVRQHPLSSTASAVASDQNGYLLRNTLPSPLAVVWTSSPAGTISTMNIRRRAYSRDARLAVMVVFRCACPDSILRMVSRLTNRFADTVYAIA